MKSRILLSFLFFAFVFLTNSSANKKQTSFGQVIVFRAPAGVNGALMEATVLIDDKEKITLKSGEYSYIPVKSGYHTITLESSDHFSKEKKKFKIGSNQQIFFEVEVNPAQAATFLVVPILSTVAQKGFFLKHVKKNDFESKKHKLKKRLH